MRPAEPGIRQSRPAAPAAGPGAREACAAFAVSTGARFVIVGFAGGVPIAAVAVAGRFLADARGSGPSLQSAVEGPGVGFGPLLRFRRGCQMRLINWHIIITIIMAESLASISFGIMVVRFNVSVGLTTVHRVVSRVVGGAWEKEAPVPGSVHQFAEALPKAHEKLVRVVVRPTRVRQMRMRTLVMLSVLTTGTPGIRTKRLLRRVQAEGKKQGFRGTTIAGPSAPPVITRCLTELVMLTIVMLLLMWSLRAAVPIQTQLPQVQQSKLEIAEDHPLPGIRGSAGGQRRCWW